MRLVHFILSLSDRVLATRLAIYLLEFPTSASFLYSEFNIVLSLGWFSITTHHVTVSLLHGYCLRNTVAHN